MHVKGHTKSEEKKESRRGEKGRTGRTHGCHGDQEPGNDGANGQDRAEHAQDHGDGRGEEGGQHHIDAHHILGQAIDNATGGRGLMGANGHENKSR